MTPLILSLLLAKSPAIPPSPPKLPVNPCSNPVKCQSYQAPAQPQRQPRVVYRGNGQYR